MTNNNYYSLLEWKDWPIAMDEIKILPGVFALAGAVIDDTDFFR